MGNSNRGRLSGFIPLLMFIEGGNQYNRIASGMPAIHLMAHIHGQLGAVEYISGCRTMSIRFWVCEFHSHQ